MENKIDDNKAVGLVWYTISVLIILNIWRNFNTLPGEFLLGAFSIWSLRNCMDYFKKAEKSEDE
jgi:hypothetical protein